MDTIKGPIESVTEVEDMMSFIAELDHAGPKDVTNCDILSTKKTIESALPDA